MNSRLSRITGPHLQREALDFAGRDVPDQKSASRVNLRHCLTAN